MYFSRSFLYFFPVCALRGHLKNFLSMSAFIDTPNPIFYSLPSVARHVALKFVSILSRFNAADCD